MQVEEGNLLFKSIERQTQLQRRGLDWVTGTSSAETHHHLFRLKCIITFMCKSARVLTGLDWTGLFPHLCSVEHVHRIRRRRRRGSWSSSLSPPCVNFSKCRLGIRFSSSSSSPLSLRLNTILLLLQQHHLPALPGRLVVDVLPCLVSPWRSSPTSDKRQTKNGEEEPEQRLMTMDSGGGGGLELGLQWRMYPRNMKTTNGFYDFFFFF